MAAATTVHLITQSVTDHTVATGSINLNRGVALACRAAVRTVCYELPPKAPPDRPWRPAGVEVATCPTADALLDRVAGDLAAGSVVVKFWAALRGEDWRADLAVARLAQARGVRCVYVDTDAMWRLPHLLGAGGHLPAALQAYAAVLLFFGGPRAAREYRALCRAPVHLVSAAVAALPLLAAQPAADPPGPGFDLGCVVSNYGEREQRTLAELARLSRRRPGTAVAFAGCWPPAAAELPGAVPYPAADPGDLLRLYRRCRYTLNPLRADFAGYSHTASVRLFEAAAAGSVIATERFPGLPSYFEPGLECQVYSDAADLAGLLDLPEDTRLGIAGRARLRLEREAAAAAGEVARLLVGP